MRRREATIRGLDPDLERDLLARGRVVAGVDEAGRGPLAGPVVAAAVVLDLARVPRGLADSKCLSPARRAALFDEILASAEVAIATASPAEIDRLNIRGASLAALCRALRALPTRPDLALVDGRDLPEGLPCAGEAMVRGDGRVASIAAASIVAKVTRDRLMARLDRHHPGYGFAGHAGYPTPEHREALRRLGPCPLHRLSFAPVRAAVRDRPGVAES